MHGGEKGKNALVISLDFELAWGVQDVLDADGAYRANLLGAREVIPRILDLFARYEVAATWATVGFLFAESREELAAYGPAERPTYADPRRDPYRIAVGSNEADDPLHFAPSLVRTIAAAPRQEVGTHTFSHYYCLEPGQTVAQFEADLRAAVAIAAAKGITLRSLVLPRHQVRTDYLPAIARAGLHVHRTNEANRLSRPYATGQDPLAIRAARLADAYLPLTGANAVPWTHIAPDAHGLVDVRESRFLRPFSARMRALEPLRVARIAGAMRVAAERRAVCHLWWHPHNFGVHQDGNLANLRALLEAFARLRDSHGMASMTMAAAADAGAAATAGA
jgi:peptidoglycan/xylan/chitin deacetylase (PgdA/CDA1 family)